MKVIRSREPNWPISLVIPDDWECRDILLPRGVGFFLRGPFPPEAMLAPAISVEAQIASQSTLEEAVQEWLTRRGVLKDFRLLARHETTLAGSPAVLLDACYQLPRLDRVPEPTFLSAREQDVLALLAGRIYTLSYRAEAEHFDTFQPVFTAVRESFALAG